LPYRNVGGDIVAEVLIIGNEVKTSDVKDSEVSRHLMLLKESIHNDCTRSI